MRLPAVKCAPESVDTMVYDRCVGPRSAQITPPFYAYAGHRGMQRVLLDLIELLDDLDRALEAGDSSPLRQGIELVRRRFLAVLASHGVTPIVALGEPFDPAIHDAVSMLPAATREQAGRVIAVVRAGYRMGDAALRPAGVVVAKSS